LWLNNVLDIKHSKLNFCRLFSSRIEKYFVSNWISNSEHGLKYVFQQQMFVANVGNVTVEYNVNPTDTATIDLSSTPLQQQEGIFTKMVQFFFYFFF
jgi:hypothetical protein